jgi:hypothetical protein
MRLELSKDGKLACGDEGSNAQQYNISFILLSSFLIPQPMNSVRTSQRALKELRWNVDSSWIPAVTIYEPNVDSTVSRAQFLTNVERGAF